MASSLLPFPPDNMLQNLILDIGNVICEWNPRGLAASAFEDPAAQQEALSVTVHTSDWLDLDRGTLSVEEAAERAIARTQLDPDGITRIYQNLGASLAALPQTMIAMRRAREQGVPIYILSNMQHNAWQHLQKSFDCWNDCAGVVVSCDTGFIKPEPEIFQHLCDKFSLAPASCVFIDDMPENVEAAKLFGLQAVQLLNKHEGGRLVNELTDKIVAGSTP